MKLSILPQGHRVESRNRLGGDAAVHLAKVAEECKSQAASMTKADLISIIADKLKFHWARAELLIDVVFGCMEQSMSRGEKIEMRTTCPSYPHTQRRRG
jgi:hypothetical protein